MEAARYTGNKNYRALVLRASRPQLTQPGGLVDTSLQMYSNLKGKFRQTNLKWIFPSGAEVMFGAINDEESKRKFDGSQMALIAFDELIHFSEEVFFYLLSRNRTSDRTLPCRVLATTNPSPTSWLRRFVSWWIDEETGYAIKERSGIKRYLVRESGEIHWFDDRESADAFARSITPQTMLDDGLQIESKSVTFIPSSIADNKALMMASPEYISSLFALPLVERERLLNGNWNVVATAGAYFKPEYFEIMNAAPVSTHKVRFWDRAATMNGGDYTVGVLMSRDTSGYFYIEDMVRLQASPKGVEDAIVNTASQDGPHCVIGLEQEPGASGKAEAGYLTRALAGYKVKLLSASSNKTQRASPLSSQAEANNVKIVKGDWNKDLIRELCNFSGDKDEHDDVVDACSGCFALLSMKKPLPFLDFGKGMTTISKWFNK